MFACMARNLYMHENIYIYKHIYVLYLNNKYMYVYKK